MRPSELLPNVYEELRKMASAKMLHEQPQTLDATALVHEAWLKLGAERSFASKSDYLRAAAEAMRRILIDHARQRKTQKRREDQRVEFREDLLIVAVPQDDLLALDEALKRLAETQPKVVELVQLRYFVGMTIPEAAAALEIAPRTADAWWAYARGWLAAELKKS